MSATAMVTAMSLLEEQQRLNTTGCATEAKGGQIAVTAAATVTTTAAAAAAVTAITATAAVTATADATVTVRAHKSTLRGLRL